MVMVVLLENFSHSPGVLASVHCFELARAINRFAGHKKSRRRGGPVVKAALEAFELVSSSIGLLSMDPHTFHAEVKQKRSKAMGLDITEIEETLAKRELARKAKDWQASDKIRTELQEKGILIMDTPQGVEWRVQL